MEISRRELLQGTIGAVVLAAGEPVAAQPAGAGSPIEPGDRVFLANEESNTISVIDPRSNAIETTVNLTSFDEDPRPPFRLVTAGAAPAHTAMIHKPLYHGAIDIRGVSPSPNGRYLATVGRGTSNLYLIDAIAKRVVGNTPNPQAGPTTNAERLTSGILVGREPHEATFTRNGMEIWVALRGEDRIAIVRTEAALKESGGIPSGALRAYLPTVQGPAQVWFSQDGRLAFVASQKIPRLDVFQVNTDAEGLSHPVRKATLDTAPQDAHGCTAFLKTSPDGREVWLSHALSDQVSAIETAEPHRTLDVVPLGAMARPNQLEFVRNERGRVVYVSLARVDAGGPGAVASSQIAVIDQDLPPGSRKVVGTFFTRGREAHGLWTNPSNTLLYVAHEQDELPGTPLAGQTVCTTFDVSNPLAPVFLAQIPLGALGLPSGPLRNKKSTSVAYVRPGLRRPIG